MPRWIRTVSRYRPRLLTMLLLIVIAALLLLANMSDDIRFRHQAAGPRFDARERDNEYRDPTTGFMSVVNVSYGWPLLWRQHGVVFLPLGKEVLGPLRSPSRLVVNLLTWLTMLAGAAAACEWLLRRYRLRLRWSLRTMLVAVGLIAAMFGWLAAARKQADVQDAVIAAITENNGADVWIERRGPKWLDAVGAERFRRRVVRLSIGNDIDALKRGGVFSRLGELSHLRHLDLDASCLNRETIESLRQMRRMQTLFVDGKIRAGDSEKELAWRGCFAAIGRMPQLVHLHLDGHRVAIASDSLACWSVLTNLKTLCLYNFTAHDAPLLKHLPPLPNLDAADFGYSRIGDDDLTYLAALPNLRTLILTDTKVTGAGLAALAPSESLEELSISADAASAAGFESLRALKRLKKLHIDLYRTPSLGVGVLDELAIDRGGVILVPARELEGCGAALDDLWQSKPELVIDNNCEPLQWDAETNESLGYEKFPNTIETAVHQALREWKLQQEAK